MENYNIILINYNINLFFSGAVFYAQSNLNRHKQTHTGIKPFKCDVRFHKLIAY